MRETTYRYVCDICGSDIPEIAEMIYGGNSITIREGIVNRPVVMDLCKSCYENMKTYCKTHKKENEDADNQ